jgi:hypothetical protein
MAGLFINLGSSLPHPPKRSRVMGSAKRTWVNVARPPT